MSRPLLLLVLLVFGAYSAYAVAEVGYLGIFTSHFHIAGVQVIADLVIALALFIVWMIGDARSRGRNPWPFVALTLGLGSIGALLYLLLGRGPADADRRA